MSSGYHEIAQGNHPRAREFFAQVRDRDVTPNFFLHWHWRMHAQLGATEARLCAGDIQSARREADGFMEAALSVADPNLRAFAWEVKSRVARAERDGPLARECINHALAVLDTYESPVTWVVHRTAWDIFRDEGDYQKAQWHRARAKEMIMAIADTFEPGEPLRECFLSVPQIRRILEQAATP
jgi:hypothetical protein